MKTGAGIFLFLCFYSVFTLLHSQENLPARQPEISSYLIPETVYVGDHGRLVISLGSNFISAEPFVYTALEDLIKKDDSASLEIFNDINILRIELEQKLITGGQKQTSYEPNLYIDFIPYKTGTIFLPAIILPSNQDIEIKGISFNIASVLKPNDSSLADQYGTIALPGTGLMLFIFLAVVLTILFLLMRGNFLIKKYFYPLRQKIYKKKLLREMDNTILLLKLDYRKDKNPEHLFSILSGKFRGFLSLFTGVDCRTQTPVEFREINFPLILDNSEKTPLPVEVIDREYLADLFSRWELIRFGGYKNINANLQNKISFKDAFLNALDEVLFFTGKLREKIL